MQLGLKLVGFHSLKMNWLKCTVQASGKTVEVKVAFLFLKPF